MVEEGIIRDKFRSLVHQRLFSTKNKQRRRHPSSLDDAGRDKFLAVWVEQPANPANASSYLPWIESAVVRCRMNATEATMTATTRCLA